MTLIPDQPTVFERGDKIYFTAPVQGFAPTAEQIEEYAFASQVKKQAPNENLLWLKGQYVEADQPNLNGMEWRAGEIALKSLTPMLMPVTVMHDPRTAVGTIADVALRTPEKDKIQRARLDTILAIWEHRFPEVAAEVRSNLDLGQLMQSMECFSPWYECSSCSMVFHKLPHGAERSQWCDHLKAGEGVSFAAGHDHQTQAWRILGDVCFTGTGLIFGTRGAKGALATADLEAFQEEVAEHHQRVHTDTARTARSSRMGLVQIEQSELDTLRAERDKAREDAANAKAVEADAVKKVETAEAAQKAAEGEKAEAEKERDKLKEGAEKAALKDKRIGELGDGFVAKLGDFTRGRLEDQAKSYSDEEWEGRLKELEETAGVKRDAEKEGGSEANKGGGNGGKNEEGKTSSGFESEEVAAFVGRAGGNGQPSGGDGANPAEVRSTVGSLARSMRPKRETASKS